MRDFLLRCLKALGAFPIILILLFEEWDWAPLAALAARLFRMPFWETMAQRIANLPPWAALMVLVVPMVALFPLKMLALYLFGAGHAGAGLLLLLGAKITGTALVAGLFQLIEPALMQLAWFAKWYPRWKIWKDQLMNKVRQSMPWRLGRVVKRKMRTAWRRLRA